jgi:hypothetical protein
MKSLYELLKIVRKHSNSKYIYYGWSIIPWKCTEISVDMEIFIKEVVDGKIWIVYTTDRGIISSVDVYKDISAACYSFIEKLGIMDKIKDTER